MNSRTINSLALSLFAFVTPPVVMTVWARDEGLVFKFFCVSFIVMGATGIMSTAGRWRKSFGYSSLLGLYQWLMSTPLGLIGQGRPSVKIPCVVPNRVNIGKRLTALHWGELSPYALQGTTIEDCDLYGDEFAGDRDARSHDVADVAGMTFRDSRFHGMCRIVTHGNVSFVRCDASDDAGWVTINAKIGHVDIVDCGTEGACPPDAYIEGTATLSVSRSHIRRLTVLHTGVSGDRSIDSDSSHFEFVSVRSTADARPDTLSVAMRGKSVIDGELSIEGYSPGISIEDESYVALIGIASANIEPFDGAVLDDAEIGAYLCRTGSALDVACSFVEGPAIIMSNVAPDPSYGPREGVTLVDLRDVNKATIYGLLWATSQARGHQRVSPGNAAAVDYLIASNVERGDESVLTSASIIYPNAEV